MATRKVVRQPLHKGHPTFFYGAVGPTGLYVGPLRFTACTFSVEAPLFMKKRRVVDDLIEALTEVIWHYSHKQLRDKRRLKNGGECLLCPPNKGENAKRKPKPDKYKTKRKGR